MNKNLPTKTKEERLVVYRNALKVIEGNKRQGLCEALLAETIGTNSPYCYIKILEIMREFTPYMYSQPSFNIKRYKKVYAASSWAWRILVLNEIIINLTKPTK